MRVGIAQIECRVGDVAANLRTISSMVERAAGAGCDLVVLPEMSDTGYDMEAIRAHASAWNTGPCVALRKVAADLRIAVICGLSEREGDRVYNSVAVIDAAGALVSRYRKAHLFSIPAVREDKYLAPGDSFTLTRVGGFSVGLMICYDLRFPEMMRALALGGADVLVVVASWPARRLEHWKILTAARAIENQVYLVAANRVGADGPLEFGGTSRLIDPYGTQIASGSEDEQMLVVGEISRDRIARTRSGMAVFHDRREDLYGKRLERQG